MEFLTEVIWAERSSNRLVELRQKYPAEANPRTARSSMLNTQPLISIVSSRCTKEKYFTDCSNIPLNTFCPTRREKKTYNGLILSLLHSLQHSALFKSAHINTHVFIINIATRKLPLIWLHILMHTYIFLYIRKMQYK